MFRERALVLKPRTQLGNALRGHLAEYGWAAPQGTAHLAMLAELDKRIAAPGNGIAQRAREDGRILSKMPHSYLRGRPCQSN